MALAMLVSFSATIAVADPSIIDPTEPVTLTIHHFTLPDGTVAVGDPTGTAPNPQGDPVEDADWTIRRIVVPAGTTWDGTVGSVQTSWLQTAIVRTTGSNGQAFFDENADGSPLTQGIYMVTGPADANIIYPPFLVSLPMWLVDDPTDPTTGEWLYNVHAFPKEAPAPDFGKTLDSFEHEDDGTIRATWEFTVTIQPGIIALVEQESTVGTTTDVFLRIVDVLDPRLTFVEGDPNPEAYIVVEFQTGSGPATWQALTYGTDWTFSVTTAGTPERETVTIDFLEPGIEAIAEDGYVGGDIRVRFDTHVRSDAYDIGAGLGDIPNTGRIYYGSLPGVDIPDPEIPEIRIHQIEVTKVVALTNAPLAGAVFRLFRAEDVNSTTLRPIDVDDYIMEVTTGADGIALFQPLAAGDFYLYEYTAPTGFVRIPNAMAISISADPAVAAPYIVRRTIDNAPISTQPGPDGDLPMTGGTGTLIFTAVGLALIGGSILFLLLVGKKKKHHQS